MTYLVFVNNYEILVIVSSEEVDYYIDNKYTVHNVVKDKHVHGVKVRKGHINWCQGTRDHQQGRD